MDDFLSKAPRFQQMTVQNIVHVMDVLLVAFLVYKLFMLVRGTRAWRVLGGIVIFVLALLASRSLGLTTLHWILDKAATLAPVAMVILLLPEMRQAIEGFGKLGFWPQKLGAFEQRTEVRTIEEIVAASAEMAAARVGALMVIERTAPLDEVIGNGVRLDAKVSAALLNSIFYEGNPLHDGAAIIRADTIIAAASRLPLSESARLDHNVHMRHRAGVGITEEFDCVTVVISEERGSISVAIDGRLRRVDSPQELRDILNREVRGEDSVRDRDKEKKRRARAVFRRNRLRLKR